MALTIKAPNLRKIQAKLARLPKAAAEALAEQLRVEVDALVEAQKRAAPVDPSGPEAGKFRDSIHAYKNPDRVLSYRIIADAKDDTGHLIGAHIEFGHRAADGTHVAARPSFYPTYRARKAGMRRRMSAKARKAIRAEWNSGS